MGELTGACEFCKADSERAFVKYHGDPNDAQTETDWGEHLPPTVYAIVCMACGEPVGFLDPRDENDLPPFDELPDGTGDTAFRVDETLE